MPTSPNKQRKERRKAASATTAHQQSESQPTYNNVPRKLDRPHIPPLCAPTQSKFVPVTVAPRNDGGRCAYWPVCDDDRKVCGGYRPELCKTFGANGTEKAPSQSELNYQRHLKTWNTKNIMSNCAWYPFCGKAVYCGGLKKIYCSVYGGDNPVKEPPSVEVLKKAKRDAKNNKRKEDRMNKK